MEVLPLLHLVTQEHQMHQVGGIQGHLSSREGILELPHKVVMERPHRQHRIIILGQEGMGNSQR